jgi:hypothetical protein
VIVLDRITQRERKRQRRARNRRYWQSQRDGVEVYGVRITLERHRRLITWLRLGGHTDEVDRVNGGEIIGRLIDALDV